jgi:hypothetical protein
MEPNMLTKLAERELRDQGYEIEVAQTAFSSSYATAHIKLPDNRSLMPDIIGWAGPARCGTTSLLFLLAGNEGIGRAYFQPLKTLLRLGGPDFVLRASDNLVCMKEVFRGCCRANNHDPIGMLINAGVPPHKIKWIAMLRDPVQNYQSWLQHIAGCTPESYLETQIYTIEFYKHYAKKGVNIVPFAYELLKDNEQKSLNALFGKLGIDLKFETLDFHAQAIEEKISYGQAEDINYFNMSILPILYRGRFVYTPHSDDRLSSKMKQVLRDACLPKYDAFYEHSRKELGL